MNILLGIVVTVVATAVTTGVMLLVRRRAPEGSYFSDGDRASGVFGVLATGFSVLLGFLIFLAFTSYDQARSGAEDEATIVVQQVETAQFMPGDAGEELTAELVCYARSVVGPEWEALDDGDLDHAINPWAVAMYQTLRTIEPKTNAEQSTYDQWLEQTGDRQQARNDRIHGAEGILPTPLWLGLLAIAIVIFVYMLFFADSSERAATQAMLMASVTVVITVLLCLLVFFDHPHGDGVGKLHPTAMERSLHIMDAELDAAGLDLRVPCDERGTAI